MSSLQIRPRFKIKSPLSKEVVLKRLEDKLSVEHAPCEGKVVSHHVVLSIPEDNQHFWSPQLHLEVEDTEDGSLIRGLFGPKPTVWTFFVFMYSVIGLFGMIALTYGYSQWSLGVNSWGLWGIPLSLVLAILVYIIARTGQHLGKEQMRVLSEFLDSTVKIE